MQLLRDLWLLVKSYPISCKIVRELNDLEHAGVVKTQICYQKVRTALVKEAKYVDSKITGSIVYIALSLAAYLHSK
jgi:hypothetical protein